MSWTWIKRAVKESERNPNMAFCKTWYELTRMEMKEVHFLSFDLSNAIDSNNIIRIHHESIPPSHDLYCKCIIEGKMC